ncbi:MAG: bis(5'-nucleosyl)-tetraphosphatase (symmetrical) YqeK [Peptoniphilus sp.]|nr:bis(5'-nucleosyl)-tetraphosphatase (symmetrical) YqeK [Peptoniphilus sp.]
MENQKNEMISLIGQKRYEHILRVRDVAVKLAEQYGISVEKAEIAAYYHDCAKAQNFDEIYELCKKYGLKLSYDMQKAPKIIHAFLGAIMAREKFGVEDEDILNAIRYHTTGRENMSILEKIIFVSDYIEPNRKFDGIDEIRDLAFRDLDRALYKSLNNTIEHLLLSDEYIVGDTIKARNYIMEKYKWENSLKHL